jgi:hypothetical protein
METDVEHALQNPSRNMVNFFWPARLHQALSLPSYIDVAYRQVWAQTIIAEYSLAPGPRWLDLSQVHFNPYFTALFEVCIRFPYGHCSIDLVPGQRYLTASPIIRSKELGDLVKGMFVTQPPCNGLGIYVDGEGLHHRTKRINNVHSEEGVRIGQLLDSLDECIPEIIDHWSSSVLESRDILANRVWTGYSFDNQRETFWDWMERWPTLPILVVLETVEGVENNLARLSGGGRQHIDDCCAAWQKAFLEWSKDVS